MHICDQRNGKKVEGGKTSAQMDGQEKALLKRIRLSCWILIGSMFGFYFLYPFHVPISYFETDFLDYCIGIESLDHVELKTPYKRSAFAALLPYALSRYLGVINGIAVASLLCYFGTICIAVCWIYELTKQRLSVPISILLCCMMGPILSLSRMLNFYPEILFFCLLGSYFVHLALQKATGLRMFLGGLAIAFSFLVDVRGLLWGLCFGVLMLIPLFRKRKPAHLLAVLVPVLIGWKLGSWAYHRFHSPLSRQLDLRPLYNKIEASNPLYAPPHTYPEGFLWGRSSLLDFFGELQFLVEQAFLPTPQGFYDFSIVSKGVLWYWGFWLVITVIALLYLWRRKKNSALLSFLALLPFFYSYWKLPDVVEPHIRFYAQCMPALLVVIGVALTEFLSTKSLGKIAIPVLVTGLMLSIFCVPKWGVSRVILNAHIKMSIPEAEDIFRKNNIHPGFEVHLYVSPITKRESFLASSWFQYCNRRLRKDGIIVPFYERLKHEK